MHTHRPTTATIDPPTAPLARPPRTSRPRRVLTLVATALGAGLAAAFVTTLLLVSGTTTPAAAGPVATPTLPAATPPSAIARANGTSARPAPTHRRAAPAATPSASAPTCLRPGEAAQAARSTASEGEHVAAVSHLQCDGAWAVGLIRVDTVSDPAGGEASPGYGYTGVFRWSGGSWRSIDRTTVCPGQVPASLQDLACNTN